MYNVFENKKQQQTHVLKIIIANIVALPNLTCG